jgi:glycerol-3-phosphate acyltransferase PlsX
MQNVVVSVDVMGGDNAPEAVVAGAIMATKKMPNLTVKLVGQKNEIDTLLKAAKMAYHPQIEVVDATDKIASDEVVDTNIRRRTESSLVKAINLVKKGEVDGVVSLGNTAVTVAAATLLLGRIPGVFRPAIATIFPRSEGRITVLLDGGATVDCTPEYLAQFADLGYAYAQSIGFVDPKVGLLSIGEEQDKGNSVTKSAYKILKDRNYFIGNVQGNDITNGPADVIICDGFTGNIVLKAIEGIPKLLKSLARESLISAILAKLLFKRIGKPLDYRTYGGCPVLGLNGLCFIGHGKSDDRAACNAILAAAMAIQNNLLEGVNEALRT